MLLQPKYLRPMRVLALASLLVIAGMLSARLQLSFWLSTGLFCIAAAIDQYLIDRVLKLP